MTERPSMRDLYRRLQRQGFPRKFVREFALPDWWDDEAASTPAGLATGMMYIARHLGVSLESMQQPEGVIRLREFGRCKFKKMGSTAEDELGVARAIATRIAHIALAASTNDCVTPPNDPLAVRDCILSSADFVNLESLTRYCWEIGIPVVHVRHFPSGRKKMHGLATIKDGRPVIVISKNNKNAAWLLFILAHELAHIALGHIEEGEVVIDNDSSLEDEGDNEEQEADRFALELLRGQTEIMYPGPGWPNAAELARWAGCEGKSLGIDPGHLVLSYAHAQDGGNFYPVAQAALNQVQGSFDAIGFLRDCVASNLDWSALPEETCEFFAKIVLDSSLEERVSSEESISA